MPPQAGALCVHCRTAPVSAPWRPFCSERCKLLDLARWADGDFRIPGEPVPPDPASGEPAPTEP